MLIMVPMEFTANDVFTAYKKVKHYFYYDNTSLFIRKRVAEFEEEIKLANENDNYMAAFWRRMERIAIDLTEKPIDWWEKYFNKNIALKMTPKSFKNNISTILTNKSETTNLELEKINLFIDTTIEVHIISVLWLMHVGNDMSKLIDKDNWAYKLVLTDTDRPEIVDGLRIYKPYYMQYQSWRDKAIEKAEELLKEKEDVVILSLDIKEYFNSVRIKLADIQDKICGDGRNNILVSRLFELLSSIHKIHTEKVKNTRPGLELDEFESVLPIGLLSSGLLGNFYLKGFDAKIKDAVNPAYYGRYVDDILLVLKNVKVDVDAISPVNEFLSKYLVSRKILAYSNIESLPSYLKKAVAQSIPKKIRYKYEEARSSKDTEEKRFEKIRIAKTLTFQLKDIPNLKIQSDKVVLQFFDHKESPAIINKFKKNIEKNRSEFRYLPEEDKVDAEFDEEAFSLHYNDSVNKLRSIKEFSEDKYGASKYLAGKIFSASVSREGSDEKTTKQILTFFKGKVCLSFHSLWEKVATYFIITNNHQGLNQFYRQIVRAIENVNYDGLDILKSQPRQKAKIKKSIRKDLIDFMTIAIATPIAYNPQFLERLKRNGIDETNYTVIALLAKKIRHANMFRHAWLGLPGVNYTRYLFANESKNDLLDISDGDLAMICPEKNEQKVDKTEQISTLNLLDIDQRLKYLSPRYVHFHDLNVLQIFKVINSICDESLTAFKEFDNILPDAFKSYWLINQEWKYYSPDNLNTFEDWISDAQKTYFDIHPSGDSVSQSGDEIDEGYVIRIANSKKVTGKNSQQLPETADKKIALANIKVNPKNVSDSYLGSPNTSKARRHELFKLINLVEKERCDMLVLPEVSIPYKWINLLAYQSAKRSIGIIAGLEHWVNKAGFAFNFVATILPVTRNNYNTCIIRLRLKNHYSHEEKRQLEGYRLLVPSKTNRKRTRRYDLFHWKGSYFSVYNCFELADINDRSLFKSKVDFIIASEYNRDTTYFSDIGMSWVRDLHCFFIQVNSSDYGDSVIIQPSSSAFRSILQIKGGDNSTIVVGNLPINKLRDFQLKEYDLQKDDKTFKPTPPDFDRQYLKKRMKNLPYK